MNTDNIVLWEIQHGNVDLDYFKTLLLPMWEILLKNADSVFFQDTEFAGDLEDSKSTSGTRLFHFRVSNVRTTLSHGTTESQIISLDAGLRMNVIPALHL